MALASSAARARAFALGFGAVYLLVAIIGFADGSDVLNLIPINQAENFLHLAISPTRIAAGLASRPKTHTARTG